MIIHKKINKINQAIKLLGAGLIFIFVTACHHAMRVDSIPEKADIYLMEGVKEIKLGEAPLDLARTREITDRDKEDTFHIRVVKTGYTPVDVLVDRLLFQDTLYKIRLRLKPPDQDYLEEVLLSDVTKIDRMLDKIFSAQNMIISGQYEQAGVFLEELEKKYSNLAIIFALRANMHINKGETDLALQNFVKAQKLDPDNPHYPMMINQLSESPDDDE